MIADDIEIRTCAVANCATGARLRTCHECEARVCLEHSRIAQVLVWSNNESTSFTAKRMVRCCLPCADEAKMEMERADDDSCQGR